VQLSGESDDEYIEGLTRPVQRVIHLPAETGAPAAIDDNAQAVAERVVRTADAYFARSNVAGIVLDTADPARRGGTGRRSKAEIAARVA
jgi:hypothetical protein